MSPTEQCHAEMARCLATPDQPGWFSAIWYADWHAELWMIEREAV